MPSLNPDTNACIGAGICTNTAPTVFDLGADGLVRLRTTDVDTNDVPDTDAAIAMCPAQALSWSRS
ncbi:MULTISPECIES: ferredoxin [unclassified Leifsonia]|uniref:ferredoxin n=1 Tax=unclassified Leifsonia TaxID=2663824 RepID=UPI0008A72F7F|nr:MULTISPECIES: ferredoxin [unclassified Leifsonia]SEI15079.1 ferredoxin [Leifsonia sp. CL154]SFM03890.1 ferredoxin [Leifsonia sp. CL147]